MKSELVSEVKGQEVMEEHGHRKCQRKCQVGGPGKCLSRPSAPVLVWAELPPEEPLQPWKLSASSPSVLQGSPSKFLVSVRWDGAGLTQWRKRLLPISSQRPDWTRSTMKVNNSSQIRWSLSLRSLEEGGYFLRDFTQCDWAKEVLSTEIQAAAGSYSEQQE